MKMFPRLTPSLRKFIEEQPIFFVATAAEDGRINLSPKGADSLRVLDDNNLLWLNLTGSGNETAGHIRALNRITMMFCSFTGNPLIMRLYGTVDILHAHDEGWEAAIARFPEMAGTRQVFDMKIETVQTSCGMGVPLMDYQGERAGEQLVAHFEKLGPDGVTDFWRRKNTHTIDGLETGVLPE